MTRVLIISYYFAPQNQIGAVRPTKLAKYLTRLGCDITVICGTGLDPQLRDPTLMRDLRELKDVRVINEWNPLRTVRSRLRKGARSTGGGASLPARKPSYRARAMDATYRYLRLKGDRSFERKAKRELKKLEGAYDVVLSSYGPLSVHNVAWLAKRRGLAKKWIADFRDEVGSPFGWLKHYERGYLRMLQRDADLKIAASEGFLQLMHFEGRMLSNGFDREDLPEARPPEGGKLFRAVYCGQLNEGRQGLPARDVTPCLAALRALCDEGLLSRDELQLVYAGNQGELFRQYAAVVGLEDRALDMGQVCRERSLELQQQADLLLMASVNTRSQYGILTGKLFEYLMMMKPIACCMQGDLAESAIKRMLARTGAGFCWEAANAQADTPALAGWLREIIYNWRQDLPTLTAKNKEQIELYCYPRLASTLLDWIHECGKD